MNTGHEMYLTANQCEMASKCASEALFSSSKSSLMSCQCNISISWLLKAPFLQNSYLGHTWPAVPRNILFHQLEILCKWILWVLCIWMRWRAEVALQNQLMGVDFLPWSVASRGHDNSPANNKPAKSVVMMENTWLSLWAGANTMEVQFKMGWLNYALLVCYSLCQQRVKLEISRAENVQLA